MYFDIRGVTEPAHKTKGDRSMKFFTVLAAIALLHRPLPWHRRMQKNRPLLRPRRKPPRSRPPPRQRSLLTSRLRRHLHPSRPRKLLLPRPSPPKKPLPRQRSLRRSPPPLQPPSRKPRRWPSRTRNPLRSRYARSAVPGIRGTQGSVSSAPPTRKSSCARRSTFNTSLRSTATVQKNPRQVAGIFLF